MREYWNAGKPGFVWALLDMCEENKDFLEKFADKYHSTSQYFGSKGLVALTFELPVAKIPSSFTRID